MQDNRAKRSHIHTQHTHTKDDVLIANGGQNASRIRDAIDGYEHTRIRLFFARLPSIKFVMYRDWQCCLLAKYYRLLDRPNYARITLFPSASTIC